MIEEVKRNYLEINSLKDLKEGNKPSEDYFAKGSVTYGKFDHRQGRVYLNIPLADGLYSSVSGYMIDSDGWQRSVRTNEKYNGIKAHGVRGALRLEGSKITWDASIDYSFQDHQNMQSITDPTVESTNRDAGRNSAAWALGSPRLNDIYLTPCRNGSSPFDWIANGCQANVTKGLNAYSNIKIEAADWMTIDVITGWRDLDHDFVSPLFASLRGGVELPLVNAGNHNVFQQEIKATGTLLDGKLTYTTGIFALKEGNFTRFQTSLSGPAGIILTLDDTTMANDATDLAVYLQTDVDMGNFTLTTGLRWTRNKKSLPQVLHTGANGLFDSLDIRAAGIPTSVKVSKVTPRVALAYELNEDVYNIYCDQTILHQLNQKIIERFGPTNFTGLIWKSENEISVSKEKAETLFKLLNILEENEDVQVVSSNFDVSDDILNTLTA